MFMRLKEGRYQISDISMVVICYASDIVMGYDRRRSELSNAPLHMNQDTTSIQV